MSQLRCELGIRARLQLAARLRACAGQAEPKAKIPTLHKLRSGWGTQKGEKQSEKQIPRRVAPRDDNVLG